MQQLYVFGWKTLLLIIKTFKQSKLGTVHVLLQNSYSSYSIRIVYWTSPTSAVYWTSLSKMRALCNLSRIVRIRLSSGLIIEQQI